MVDLNIRNDEPLNYRLLLERIADAVIDVRIHQKRYFKTRNLNDLRESKQAERKLDLLIAQRAQIIVERGQYKTKEEK